MRKVTGSFVPSASGRLGRPVLISERVMMNPKVQWARELWGQRGVFVWTDAEEARRQLGGVYGA
jgi:hypothetical protein